jgi:hypothetical protein
MKIMPRSADAMMIGIFVSIAMGYALNRGIYVGSNVAKDTDSTEVRYCHYLVPSGITTIEIRWSYRQSYCKLFLE